LQLKRKYIGLENSKYDCVRKEDIECELMNLSIMKDIDRSKCIEIEKERTRLARSLSELNYSCELKSEKKKKSSKKSVVKFQNSLAKYFKKLNSEHKLQLIGSFSSADDKLIVCAPIECDIKLQKKNKKRGFPCSPLEHCEIGIWKV